MKLKIAALLSIMFLLLIPAVKADVISPFGGVGLIFGFFFIAFALAANFLINWGILALIRQMFLAKLTNQDKIPFSRIFFITLIGGAIDIVGWIVFWTAQEAIVSLIAKAMVILILVGITSYLLVNRRILATRDALVASALFGLISNPVWIDLVVYTLNSLS